jgi:hypothetical protein
LFGKCSHGLKNVQEKKVYVFIKMFSVRKMFTGFKIMLTDFIKIVQAVKEIQKYSPIREEMFTGLNKNTYRGFINCSLIKKKFFHVS